jgi:hypothetical protein
MGTARIDECSKVSNKTKYGNVLYTKFLCNRKSLGQILFYIDVLSFLAFPAAVFKFFLSSTWAAAAAVASPDRKLWRSNFAFSKPR